MTELDITRAFAELEKDLGLSSIPAIPTSDNSQNSYNDWEFESIVLPAERTSAKAPQKSVKKTNKIKNNKTFVVKAILLTIAIIVLLSSMFLTAYQTRKVLEATAEANSIISSASLEAKEIVENANVEAEEKIANANAEAEEIKEDIE